MQIQEMFFRLQQESDAVICGFWTQLVRTRGVLIRRAQVKGKTIGDDKVDRSRVAQSVPVPGRTLQHEERGATVRS